MQGINTEMMEALRGQRGDVKATQKLEQQEADTSPEAEGTMSEGGVTAPESLSRLAGASGELDTEQEAVQQRMRLHRGRVHDKEGSRILLA